MASATKTSAKASTVACLPVATENDCLWLRPPVKGAKDRVDGVAVTTTTATVSTTGNKGTCPRLGVVDRGGKSRPVLSVIDPAKIQSLPQPSAAVAKQLKEEGGEKEGEKKESVKDTKNAVCSLRTAPDTPSGGGPREQGMCLLAAAAVGRAVEEAPQQAQQRHGEFGLFVFFFFFLDAFRRNKEKSVSSRHFDCALICALS